MKKQNIVLIIFLLIIIIAFVIFSILGFRQEKNANNSLTDLNTNYNNYIESTENSIINNEFDNSVSQGVDESPENGQNNIQEGEIIPTENISEGSENMNNQSEEIKINLIINNKTFTATLENNQTVHELIENFPMTINMSDLNSNEKYYYLDSNLITNSSSPRRINSGDIKLFGSNCLVVFYESFSTSYSYTNLGKVDNAAEFVKELGRGNVTIRFEPAN